MPYFDNGTATIPDRETLQKYIELKQKTFANPSSYHQLGVQAKALIENCRYELAKSLKCQNNQLFFTHTITESANIVIQGVIKSTLKKHLNIHVLITSFDHISVRGFLKNNFYDPNQVNFEMIEADNNGQINLQDIVDQIRPETVLISFPYLASEIGTLQNLYGFLGLLKIININRCKQGLDKVMVFVDGASLARYVDLNLQKLDVDFLALSSSKTYGVGGACLLFIRNPKELDRIFIGGKQEAGIVPGGENVAEIFGLKSGIIKTQKNLYQELENMAELKRYFLEKISNKKVKVIEMQNQIDSYVLLTGFAADQQTILTKLDLSGVQTSLGSVCSSGGVVKGNFLDKLYPCDSVVRLVFGKQNTKEDIDIFIEML